MFTTVRQFDVQPGTIGAALQLIQEEFVPDITRVNGFVAYEAIDAGTKLVTITTFETEDGVRDSDRRSARFIADHPDLAASILNRQAVLGEVRIQRMAERPSGAYTR